MVKKAKKTGYCEIVCVIDRSGSMGSIVDDAIGGFNTFLKEQQKLPGKATLTLVQFDHEYEVICENLALKKVKPFTDKTYVPRGTTALLDAVGKTLNDVQKRIADMDKGKRPLKVIFTILTDGHENASREFSKSQIKTMIEKLDKKKSWDFMFLAANQDAFAEAHSIGIKAADAQAFAATGAGITAACASYSSGVAGRRENSQLPH